MQCSTIIINVLSLLFAIQMNISTCLKDDIYNHLGTRTPYRFKYNKDATEIKYPDCRDSKIWMIARHGTRLPSPKDIAGMSSRLIKLRKEIILNHKLGKGALTQVQLEGFRDWSHNVSSEDAKILAAEGEEEMVLLAKRMRKRFPNAISGKYNNKTFLFRYTATQRAERSAKHFAIGLFNPINAKNVIYEPVVTPDPILRFYKLCEKWRRQVKKNKSTYLEKERYGRSAEMTKSLEDISKRLGLTNVLHLDEANLMYKICGFETSWHKNTSSPWCYPFDDDSIEKLEYYNDLGHYWVDGYGHELTHRQACLSVNTMFEAFGKDEPPNSLFLFGHSGTLLKILSHLQLYKPERHLSGETIDKYRTWRTTEIDCFASNLAFVLFKCKEGDHVLTLHQERIIKLPMCDKELCPLKQMTDYFHETISNCDFNELCSIDKSEL